MEATTSINNNACVRGNRSQCLYFVDDKSYRITLQRNKLLYQLKHTNDIKLKKKIQK